MTRSTLKIPNVCSDPTVTASSHSELSIFITRELIDYSKKIATVHNVNSNEALDLLFLTVRHNVQKIIANKIRFNEEDFKTIAHGCGLNEQALKQKLEGHNRLYGSDVKAFCEYLKVTLYELTRSNFIDC